MKLKIPAIFARRIDIQRHIREINLFETIVLYFLDWRVKKAVNLKHWIRTQLEDPLLDEILDQVGIYNSNLSNRVKVRTVLKFVNTKLTYKTDKVVWNTDEKWQTIKETWEKKTGDCEDGTILAYCLLNKLDVPDSQQRISAGNVVGGGHAYLVWLSDEDGIEYPVDWTYWFNESFKLSIPYVQRRNYNYGQTEWFSFNSTAGYRARR